MVIIPHLITLALCLLVIYLAIANIVVACTGMRSDSVRGLVLLLCFFQISTIATFIVVQSGWVFGGHDELVGMSAQLGWLAYDYQNKLFHICAAVLLGHWMKCKPSSRLEK